MSITFRNNPRRDPERGKTQKHMAKSANINSIVSRYFSTGVLGNPITPGRQPFYGDFSEVPTFEQATAIVNAANEMWERLPAGTRFRFYNDPGKLINFVNDIKNEEEAIKLGLLPKPPEKPPVAEEIIARGFEIAEERKAKKTASKAPEAQAHT